MKHTVCDKCQRSISNNNLSKHHSSCNGEWFTGANRPKPPLVKDDAYYATRHQALEKARAAKGPTWNKGLTKETHSSIDRGHALRAKNFKEGKFKLSGVVFSDETKQLLREKALASPHRRLRRKMIPYNGVMLDSTWELALAQRLDELAVQWIRPDPLKWKCDRDLQHHYFPDFYLPEYDLYLDPKNGFAQTVQKEKLKALREQHTNVIILGSKEECLTFDPKALVSSPPSKRPLTT